MCPVPPYNMTRMASKGYSNPFYYYLGKDISTGTFIGWGGTEEEDPLQLLANLTTIADSVFTDSKGNNWVDGTFYAYAYTAKPYRYLPAQIEVQISFYVLVFFIQTVLNSGRETQLSLWSLLPSVLPNHSNRWTYCLVGTLFF